MNKTKEHSNLIAVIVIFIFICGIMSAQASATDVQDSWLQITKDTEEPPYIKQFASAEEALASFKKSNTLLDQDVLFFGKEEGHYKLVQYFDDREIYAWTTTEYWKYYSSISSMISFRFFYVLALPPDITSEALQDGMVGTSYSQTLSATGDAPITWTIETGSLPAGLTLSGDTISGTPTTEGTSVFQVKAANNADYVTKELSITIDAAPVVPEITPPPVITPPQELPEPIPAADEASIVEAQILSVSGEKDIPDSSFALLQLQAKKVTKNSIKIGWKRVGGAVKYVIYQNKCGQAYRKYTEQTGTTITQKKLQKNTYYKYIVAAVDGRGNVLARSKAIHVATKGGKKGNVKKVTSGSSKVTLKIKKTTKIKAKAISESGKVKVAKHRGLSYESSDMKVATVSKSGKIKAVGTGKCTIYVYAQNGAFAKVKVTVKR